MRTKKGGGDETKTQDFNTSVERMFDKINGYLTKMGGTSFRGGKSGRPSQSMARQERETGNISGEPSLSRETIKKSR